MDCMILTNSRKHNTDLQLYFFLLVHWLDHQSLSTKGIAWLFGTVLSSSNVVCALMICLWLLTERWTRCSNWHWRFWWSTTGRMTFAGCTTWLVGWCMYQWLLLDLAILIFIHHPPLTVVVPTEPSSAAAPFNPSSLFLSPPSLSCSLSLSNFLPLSPQSASLSASLA